MKSLARAFGAGVLGAALAVAAAIALILRVVTDDTTDLLVGSVSVLALCVGSFFVAWIAWFIGTVVCVSKGHFTSRDLSEVAYARTGRSSSGGESVYDDVLDELVRRQASGERVTARSMAIERRTTLHRPLAVLATDRRLVMAPMDTDGELGDDALSIPIAALATASVRSLDRDGSTRRSLPSHDDIIDLATVDGSRCRFVLAYESKARTAPNAAPDRVGGADAVRHWIRTHATTCH